MSKMGQLMPAIEAALMKGEQLIEIAAPSAGDSNNWVAITPGPMSEHDIIICNVNRLEKHCRRHEEKEHTAQHKLLIIIFNLLSATGGLIVHTVQSLVRMAK